METLPPNTPLKTLLNWSSGKDAALAYHLLQPDARYHVTHLLTTINHEHDRVFMHGTRELLLDAQASRMGLPLIKVKLPPSPDDSVYKNAMRHHLTALAKEDVHTAAYGDIFLEDLKQYREQQLVSVGFSGIFPLWKKDTAQLLQLLEDTGIEAIIVCTDAGKLGKEFLGRKVGTALLSDLPANVDPCGENGEFHSFVYNTPFFSSPVPIHTGETVYREYHVNDEVKNGFYFLDVLPGD